MTFHGKTVWITGASSGIGEALAYAFADSGARVILSARSEERLTAVHARCANPENHRVVPLDLGDSDAVSDTARRVLEEGPVDILVNNGGVSQRSTIVDTSLAVDRRIMEVNYFGAVALTKAVLPAMLERQTGHLVVISSMAGKFGMGHRSAYAASKHALHGFFDVLRTELHDSGLRVTIVCPGYVRTDISKNALRADGSANGLTEAKQDSGLAPEVFARRTLRAIQREDQEVYIGRTEVLGVYLKRFFPRLLSKILRRVSSR